MQTKETTRTRGSLIAGAVMAVLAAGAMFAAHSQGSARPQGASAIAAKGVTEDPFFRSIDPATLKRMRDQAPLVKAADLVRWEVERSSAAGFTSLRLEEREVVLRWKGAVPARIQRAIHQAWRIAPVRVESAQYSRAELREAAHRLAQDIENNPSSPFHTVRIIDDRTIRLEARPGAARSGMSLARAQRAMSQVSVPLEVGESAQPSFQSRLNDSAPWYGGARIEAWRNGARRSRCTSGFGVKDSSGREYILTAAHCATAPDRLQDPTGEFIGNVSREDWGLDILLVGTDAHHRIYDGGVGSGEFTKAVSKWDWVHANEYLCQSGSTSGVVCSIQATSNFTAGFCAIDSDGDRTCVRDLIESYKRNGGVASRGGDSGGPVFSLDGDRVVAKGTVTGGNGDTGGNLMLFQDFGTAYRTFGVTPLTGY